MYVFDFSFYNMLTISTIRFLFKDFCCLGVSSTIGTPICSTSSMSSTITAVDVEATENVEQVGVSLYSILALISRNEIYK